MNHVDLLHAGRHPKKKTMAQYKKVWSGLLRHVLVYIYQLANFVDLMSCGLKDIFKHAPCLMY